MKNILFTILFFTQNIMNAQETKIVLTEDKDGKIAYKSKDIKIKVSDTFYEWGKENPDTDNTFHYIHQTIEITTTNHQKKYSFYNYEIKKEFHLNIDIYTITPKNIKWNPYSIELIIHKK